MNNPVLILGAGISGLGAAYKLSCNGRQTVVLEKDTTYGGLCGNFTIDGFRFDRFVHFSFAKDEQVNRIFMDGAGEVFRHVPNAYNLYQGIWIKHPAQNNLYPLSQKMKDAVVRDFLSRPTDIDSSQIENYDQWLRLQFGHFFAEHFPIPYTKKYWMTEAKDLETRWMGSREGSRLYQPSVEEVIQGCNTTETPVTYYSKEMRYPQKGGFKQFLSALAENQDIRYNQQVISIDVEKRLLRTSEGDEYQFDRLISSIPLPEVIKMLKNVPVDVCNAATRLHCTCGYQISVGLKTKNIPPYLWWYIYDEDIKGKYDYKLTDTFMGFHCGNTPACKMCDSRAVKYQLIQHRLLEPAGSEPDFTRGTLEGDIAASDITFYRLQCNSEGELVSYVAEGEVLDVPTRSFGGIGIFAIKEMGRFYRHVLIEGNYPHHGAVMFGHYGKAFYEVVKFLGLDVKKIGYNQPAGVRYPTENPWG